MTIVPYTRINVRDEDPLHQTTKKSHSSKRRGKHAGPAAGNQSKVAYGRKMTGEGPTYCEKKRAGQVRGMREGDGGRVAGSPSYDTAREGKGGQVELDQRSHGRRRGTTHLLNRVPYQGGDEEMPSGGLTGKGWDTDGDEGALLAPACPGHRDHLGGGKTPTSKVLTMRHAGIMSVPQWET